MFYIHITHIFNSFVQNRIKNLIAIPSKKKMFQQLFCNNSKYTRHISKKTLKN